jgi:hypothetical protein
MIEAKYRAKQFKDELKALLKKWNTEIEIETNIVNYYEESKMVCYLDGVYEDGECLAEFTEIDLGKYIDFD